MIAPKLAPPVNKCESYANIFLFTKCVSTEDSSESLSSPVLPQRREALYKNKKNFLWLLSGTQSMDYLSVYVYYIFIIIF